MPRLPQNPAGGPPASESSGQVRHLYVIEMLLGAGLLLLVVAVFVANNRPPGVAKAEIVTLATGNWHNEVVRSSVPVVVDFWAPWCGPCKKMSEIVDEIAGEYEGKIRIGKLNIDEAPGISQRYSVQGIPLLVLLRDGREEDRLVGAVPPPQLRAWLEQHVETPSAKSG